MPSSMTEQDPARPGELLERERAAGLFTSAAAWVSVRGEPLFSGAVGDQPGGAATLYDLASLTKPLATALMVLRTIERGELELHTALGESALGRAVELAEPLRPLTVWQLLTHTAGLPAVPALAGASDPRRVLCATLPFREPGSGVLYSCTGFLLLGELLKAHTGTSLRAQFDELRSGRGSVEHSSAGGPEPAREARGEVSHGGTRAGAELLFRPDAAESGRCVPTEWDAARGGRVVGAVHDENAAALGGDAGNAGLFGTARAVHEQVIRMWGSLVGAPAAEPLLSPALAAQAAAEQAVSGEERRGLGVQLASPAAPVNERSFTGSSFGHTGFTGTSFWVEPDRSLVIVLLTNRVYYGRESTSGRLRRFRAAFHDAVLSAL